MSDAYRISESELPRNWRVESEERDEDGFVNEYAHRYLATDLELFGTVFEEEGRDRYKIELVSGDAFAGMSHPFRPTGEILDFEEAGDYSIALMEHTEQQAQEWAKKPAEAALNEVNPIRHSAPSDDGGSDQVNRRCPICEVAFTTYRGEGTYNQIKNHFEHMEDEPHRETEIELVDNGEIDVDE